MIKMPKKGEYVKFRSYGRKIKLPFMFNADLLELFWYQKIVKSKILKVLIRANMKNVLLAIIAIN